MRVGDYTKRAVRMSATTMHIFPVRPHMWLRAGGVVRHVLRDFALRLLCTIPQSPSVRDCGFGHVIVRDCLSVNRGGAPLRGRAVVASVPVHGAVNGPRSRGRGRCDQIGCDQLKRTADSAGKDFSSISDFRFLVTIFFRMKERNGERRLRLFLHLKG